MAKIATRGNKLSGVLAHEYEPETGFCREAVTVTVEAGMDVGAVVHLSGGKYVWVAAAAVATLNADVRVVIDVDTPDVGTGDKTLVTLANGPAQINRQGLQFKDTLSAGQIDTVVAALKLRNIKAKTRI